jgi:hypothetical protein
MTSEIVEVPLGEGGGSPDDPPQEAEDAQPQEDVPDVSPPPRAKAKGRPRGSKNKPKPVEEPEEELEEPPPPPPPPLQRAPKAKAKRAPPKPRQPPPQQQYYEEESESDGEEVTMEDLHALQYLKTLQRVGAARVDRKRSQYANWLSR